MNLLYISGYNEPDRIMLKVIGIYHYRFAQGAPVSAGLNCNFNLSAASGRDLLVRKERSGAASGGLYFVYYEHTLAGICKFENMF